MRASIVYVVGAIGGVLAILVAGNAIQYRHPVAPAVRINAPGGAGEAAPKGTYGTDVLRKLKASAGDRRPLEIAPEPVEATAQPALAERAAARARDAAMLADGGTGEPLPVAPAPSGRSSRAAEAEPPKPATAPARLREFWEEKMQGGS